MIRSDPRSAEKFPAPKIRDPILRKSQISGSGIRIRENLNLDPDPWIRDPKYFFYDPDPGSGSGKKRILDPLLRSLGSVGSRINGIRGSWEPTSTGIILKSVNWP